MRSQIMNVRISNMPHISEKSSPLPSFSHFCYYSRNVFYWVGGYSPPTPLGRTTGPAPIAKNLIFCSHDCFDTCRPGGQPKVFPLDPLILFWRFHVARQKRSRECRGRTIRFALCPAGAGKGVSRNLKFRRRVQGPWSCRGVLGARSHQLKPHTMEKTITE